MFRAKHILIGYFGESLAGLFLSGKGYRIVDRNIRVAGGEIDLICYTKFCLVFVEVKTVSAPEDDLLGIINSRLTGKSNDFSDNEFGSIGGGFFDRASREAHSSRTRFNPEDSLNQRKLRLIKRAASLLANGRYANKAAQGWRLDLVAVVVPREAEMEVTQEFLSKCLIRHYENIF